MVTGARLAVAALEDAGVEVAFGLPGVHNLALWRALGDSPIRLVGVRHEQTAAYAADGYARAARLARRGPDHDRARRGEHARRRRRGLGLPPADPRDRHRHPHQARRPGVWRGALHEATDQAAMFAPVVKETFQVSAAAETGAVVAEAARPRWRRPAGRSTWRSRRTC